LAGSLALSPLLMVIALSPSPKGTLSPSSSTATLLPVIALSAAPAARSSGDLPQAARPAISDTETANTTTLRITDSWWKKRALPGPSGVKTESGAASGHGASAPRRQFQLHARAGLAGNEPGEHGAHVLFPCLGFAARRCRHRCCLPAVGAHSRCHRGGDGTDFPRGVHRERG